MKLMEDERNEDDSLLCTLHGRYNLQRSGLLEPRDIARQNACSVTSDRFAILCLSGTFKLENNSSQTRPRRHLNSVKADK